MKTKLIRVVQHRPNIDKFNNTEVLITFSARQSQLLWIYNCLIKYNYLTLLSTYQLLKLHYVLTNTPGTVHKNIQIRLLSLGSNFSNDVDYQMILPFSWIESISRNRWWPCISNSASMRSSSFCWRSI